MEIKKRRVPPTSVVAAAPDADNVARAQQAKILKITTRKTYSSKLNCLSEWHSLHYPDCVSKEDGRTKQQSWIKWIRILENSECRFRRHV
ncbi:hypothetical protein F444_17690 [Phytophthora nicotianae P1976]|uniref:Uncharacterized protein n=1 Tax=Phytophthora nicotianae P1976 TaxID=1317066 RepID=A0A080ZE37_PHYNI|nr:hypothetical protein F444_17690 [Phytophthora nicotianae P1976]